MDYEQFLFLAQCFQKSICRGFFKSISVRESPQILILQYFFKDHKKYRITWQHPLQYGGLIETFLFTGKDGEGYLVKTVEYYEDNVLKSRLVYSCSYCEKIFSSGYMLVRHERMHTGVKPFKCGVCGLPCSRKDNLTVHMRRKHPETLMQAGQQ